MTRDEDLTPEKQQKMQHLEQQQTKHQQQPNQKRLEIEALTQ